MRASPDSSTWESLSVIARAGQSAKQRRGEQLRIHVAVGELLGLLDDRRWRAPRRARSRSSPRSAAACARSCSSTVSASSVSLNFPRAPLAPWLSATRMRGARGRAPTRRRATASPASSAASHASRPIEPPRRAAADSTSSAAVRSARSRRFAIADRRETRDVGVGRAARRARDHDARANGRQQRARLARRENDRRVGRRLLEQLEKRVRRLVRSFLRHHALGVADDEHLSACHRRRDRRRLNDRANRRDEDSLVAAGRLVQAAVRRAARRSLRPCPRECRPRSGSESL